MLISLFAASLLWTGEQQGGTTIVAIKTKAGIVLAGDSRIVGKDGAALPDMAKIMTLHGCAIGTWGMGRGWFEFPPDYPREPGKPHHVFYDFEPFVREATADLPAYTPKRIADALKHALEHFYEDWRHYAAHQRLPQLVSGPDYVGFLVVGYEHGRAAVVAVRIPRDPASNQIHPPELAERIPNTTGLSVAGANAAIQRVASSDGKERETAMFLAPSATAKALRARGPWLTLDEARQYSVALIQVEAQDNPGVGFPVRVATVLPTGDVSITEVSDPSPASFTVPRPHD